MNYFQEKQPKLKMDRFANQIIMYVVPILGIAVMCLPVAIFDLNKLSDDNSRLQDLCGSSPIWCNEDAGNRQADFSMRIFTYASFFGIYLTSWAILVILCCKSLQQIQKPGSYFIIFILTAYYLSHLAYGSVRLDNINTEKRQYVVDDCHAYFHFISTVPIIYSHLVSWIYACIKCVRNNWSVVINITEFNVTNI